MISTCTMDSIDKSLAKIKAEYTAPKTQPQQPQLT
jgi:hypothetical protein